MIFRETLGKNRRYHCPFCKKFSSSTSSVVLDHIKVYFSFFNIIEFYLIIFFIFRIHILGTVANWMTTLLLVRIWPKKYLH